MYRFAMVRKTLTREEVEDLVVGATILGVGGGGSPTKGLARLLEVMDSGGRFVIASLDEFHDEDLLASPYFVGSVATLETKISRKLAVKDPVAEAVSLLESRLGKKLAGTVASEIGGG